MSTRSHHAGHKIDPHVVRVQAAFVVLLASIGLAVQDPSRVVVAVLLFLDILPRAISRPQWSVGMKLGTMILHALGVRVRKVEEAPTRFSARLTILLVVAIGWFSAHGETITGLILTGLLMVLALLESAAGMCIGCSIHAAFFRVFGKDPDPDQF